jgi:aspartyl-tRNA synthetase
MEAEEAYSSVRLYSQLVKTGKMQVVSKSHKKAKDSAPAASLETVMREADPDDPLKDNYGDAPMIQSKTLCTKEYTAIKDLDSSKVGQEVWLRSRVHNTRIKGNGGFVVLREKVWTAQGVIFKGEHASKSMVKYVEGISKESVVDILALVKAPQVPIKSCSQSDVELEIRKIYVISRSLPQLPFQLEDACQPMTLAEAEREGKEDSEEAKDAEPTQGNKRARVSQKVRLDNRYIDLRTPINQALLRISSGVCLFFREFLLDRDFTEIHTPKLLAGTSEGGSNVFKFKYFNREGCLAQSPQLFKQMALMADLDRVFEIGPVFRAENSNTHRHLCEFTGLDLEMTIRESYFEVMTLIHEMFLHIFKGLNSKFSKELETVRTFFPFIEPMLFTEEPLFLTFPEAVKLLNDAGIPQEPLDDFSTENEKALGQIVKQKYNTEFYIVHRYPADVRPFYTMVCADDSNYTCSYDVFMRGEEIISGAQRVHDPTMLAERAVYKNMDLSTIQDYIDSFKYGAFPHGGCGVGLERVCMLFCGLKNIRWTSMFPRDPKRLTP